MSTDAVTSPVLPAWRDPVAWTKVADTFAVLVALALPWSTSLTGIFATAWLVTVAPTLDIRLFLQSLKRPICMFPIALFALALLGTLWSDAAWSVRFHAVGPAAKLLVLPVLFYHYERSTRGMWVVVAFLVSCTLLMAMSWIVAFAPSLTLKPPDEAERGIFVKNHINQGQEFALCVVALAYPILALLRAGRVPLALLLGAIAASFVVNMAFVIVSRTALVTMPILLVIFALLHLRWRNIVAVLSTMIVLAGAAWITSPQLRERAATFVSDYQQYKATNRATSLGTRLEIWQKSLRFIADAPIVGHGTGSTRNLFAQVAVGQPGDASAEVFGNPHNQTLNVAVQWGMIGVVVLYAMWFFHLLLFRGDGLVASIGLLVVLQNILTSLFNSHLFDFHEGWMYVLGVGVAGGMILKAGSSEAGAGSADIAHR